jgi:arylsulfatase A-like enzyme
VQRVPHFCNRRTLAFLALGVSLVVAAPPRPQATAALGRRPNVLIIVTDDQRAKTIRNMRKTRKWFKRDGMNFREAYATTPLCCPARASIFTGRYVHNHGVENNRAAATLEQRSTLQAYLRKAGYRTAMAGKYLNAWDIHRPPPYFGRWAMFSGNVSRYYNSAWNVNGTVGIRPDYTTDKVKRHGVRFLRRFEASDRPPWMLYLATAAPHRPYTPKKAYEHARVPPWNGNPAVRERDRSDKPPFVQERRVPLWKVKRIRRKQVRTLQSVDDLVERIFDELGRLRERRRTLAFFLSDNGFMWGEHGLSETYGKRPPYSEGMAVPLLMRWPGHVPRNVTTRRLVANIDIAPTVLRAAGIRPDPRWPIDGIPLTGGHARKRLLLEYYLDKGTTPEWASIRTASYQYTEYYERGRVPTFREHYDLRADPWQLRNILADHDPSNDPDVATLSDRLAADRRCEGADCP